MPSSDSFVRNSTSQIAPASRLFAITPSDTEKLPYVTSGLYVGTGGDIAVQDTLSGQTVILKNVGTGAGLPIRIIRVLASGTTASNLVGLA